GGLQHIRIDVPGSPHEVTVGFGLTHLLAAGLGKLSPSPLAGEGRRGGAPFLIVSDAAIAERHLQPLIDAISGAGRTAHVHLVPAGEAAKELAVLADIYDALATAGIDRQGVLVAMGGGTVGDVTGFAAATWMRGIRYLQLPTTLLAMVDSSIGGKTAINLPTGKNTVGGIHTTSTVFCDLDYLATLPDEEYRASLAEVIKAALIADRSFVEWLAPNPPAGGARRAAAAAGRGGGAME